MLLQPCPLGNKKLEPIIDDSRLEAKYNLYKSPVYLKADTKIRLFILTPICD